MNGFEGRLTEYRERERGRHAMERGKAQRPHERLAGGRGRREEAEGGGAILGLTSETGRKRSGTSEIPPSHNERADVAGH